MHAILGLLLLAASLGALARLARSASYTAGHSLDPAPTGALARLARTSVAVPAGSSPSGVAPAKTRDRSAFRAGPWPGLTARGAAVLGVCGAMLLGCELLLGIPRQAWPDLFLLAVVTCVPPLVGTCIVRAPGCASAVCGVYLLGRSLPSLVDTGLELPPLLLPAAVACDLSMWLVRGDLRWPAQNVWRRPRPAQRRLRTWRVTAGGAAFGAVLAIVEPPYALLLGADPANWTSGDRLLAGALATLGCACVGAGVVRLARQVRPDVEARPS